MTEATFPAMTDTAPETIIVPEPKPTEPLPLTAAGLRFLARRGSLKATAYESALRFIGLRPDSTGWTVYWLRILLTAGLLFCVAGVICFFAFNWAAMSHFLKFGLIIALIVVTGGITVWRGPDSLTGGLSLLACGLLAGPLLAVYGQYYQTGADAWELFRAWTIFLALLAMAGRQTGLWVATWVVGSLWTALGFYAEVISNMHLLSGTFTLGLYDALCFWPFLLFQLLAVVAWEAAMYGSRNRDHSFLHTSWPVRLTACFTLLLLTIVNITSIAILSDGYYHDMLLPGAPLLPAIIYMLLPAIIYIGFIGLSFWWYRLKRPDTLILSLNLFSLIAMLYAFILANVDVWNACGMLFLAIMLIGLAFGATRLALHWHRRALQRGLQKIQGENNAKPWQHLLFLRNVTLPQLQTFLGLTDDGAQAALNSNLSHLEPWYIKLILSFCGWVAALFLIGFMGFVVFEISRYHEGEVFSIFAAIFIVAGAFAVRSRVVFVRHFGLAIALAGALVLPVALVVTFEMESFWQFPILFTAIICLIFVRHQAMRALAFFGIFMSIADLFLVLYAETFQYLYVNELNIRGFFYYSTKALGVAVLAVIICLALKLWTREAHWVQSPAKDDLIRPVILTGMVGVLGFLGLYAAFCSGHTWHSRSFIWDIYSRSAYLNILTYWAGLAAGVGQIFLARLTFKNNPAISRKHRYVIYAGAMLCVFAGWWLPWLSIGLLLLALGRYIGSLALTGLSAFYLAVCLLWYYFTLQTSLLHKSCTLLAAGILMLVAGAIVYRLFYAAKKEAVHA